jgi:hypothetical protein
MQEDCYLIVVEAEGTLTYLISFFYGRMKSKAGLNSLVAAELSWTGACKLLLMFTFPEIGALCFSSLTLVFFSLLQVTTQT